MRFNRFTIGALTLAVAAAVFGPAASGTAPAQEAAQEAAKYQVGLKISTTKAVANEDEVTLSGKVSPAAPGTKVIVQVMYENQDSWHKAGKAKVQKNSTYKYTAQVTNRLDRAYRVVKPGDTKVKQGISKERALQAIGWVWLSKMTPSASENLQRIDSMPINGDDYTRTIFKGADDETAFVEFTLGRNAYVLDATYGLSDRTETGGKGSVQVKLDGTVTVAQTFDLGQSTHKKLDVSDVYRLRIDFAQVADTPATEACAGAARVLMD
jgi:hypothetical protein